MVGGGVEVGVTTSFRGKVHCWGFKTCVSFAVRFTSRSCWPTGDGVLLPKISLRYGTGVRYFIGPKSVLVVGLKFGLDIRLHIGSICLSRGIFGSASPLPDLHRFVGDLYSLLLLLLEVQFVFSLFK